MPSAGSNSSGSCCQCNVGVIVICDRFEVPVNLADDPDTIVVPVYMREVT